MNKIKVEVNNFIDEKSNDFIEISKYIWNNPEIGYKEYKASNILIKELEKNGFSIETNVANLETAFIAKKEYSKDALNIAIMSEYDSLGPELGHACGHNLFSVASVATAISLSKVIDKIKGNIYLIGTPSEESTVSDSGGKAKLIKAGVFNNMDMAIMTHAEGRFIVRRVLASSASLDVEFKGKSAHAGGAPYEGINALTAGNLMINNINAIRQQFLPRVSVNPIITKGGSTRNTIPDLCSLSLSVRASKKNILFEVLKKIENCVKAAALVTGCEYKMKLNGEIYEDLEPSKPLSKAFQENMNLLGISDYLEKEIAEYAWDAGNVSYICPTIAPYIKIGDENLVGHTDEFREASNSDEGFKGMLLGAKLMSMTIIDFLTNENLQKETKEDFICKISAL